MADLSSRFRGRPIGARGGARTAHRARAGRMLVISSRPPKRLEPVAAQIAVRTAAGALGLVR